MRSTFTVSRILQLVTLQYCVALYLLNSNNESRNRMAEKKQARPLQTIQTRLWQVPLRIDRLEPAVDCKAADAFARLLNICDIRTEHLEPLLKTLSMCDITIPEHFSTWGEVSDWLIEHRALLSSYAPLQVFLRRLQSKEVAVHLASADERYAPATETPASRR